MSKRPAPPTEQVVAAFQRRGRTQLHAWFWDNWDRLPPYEKYRVSWVAVAAALNAIPVLPPGQGELTPGMVRKTYERVAKEKAALRASPPAASPASPAPSLTAPVTTNKGIPHADNGATASRPASFRYDPKPRPVDPDIWGPRKK